MEETVIKRIVINVVSIVISIFLFLGLYGLYSGISYSIEESKKIKSEKNIETEEHYKELEKIKIVSEQEHVITPRQIGPEYDYSKLMKQKTLTGATTRYSDEK